MAKNKTKHIIPFIVFTALFAVSFVICYGPYLNLRTGSLLKAVLDGLSMLLTKYVGFVSVGKLSEFTLLPLVVLFWLLSFDFLINSKWYTVVSHCLLFASSYVVLGYFDIADISWLTAGLPMWVKWISLAVLVLCVFESIFAIVRDFVLMKKRKIEKFNRSPEGREKAFKERVAKMTEQDAIESLKAVKAPKLDTFKKDPVEEQYLGNSSVRGDMFSAIFEESNFERENHEKREHAESEKKRILRDLFKPRNIEKIIEEEAKEEPFEFEFDNSDLLDIQLPETAVTQTVNKSVDVKETIIDEGSEIDDAEAEKAAKSVPKKGNMDLLSAVGGLTSAKNGDYLYDSTKISYKFPPEDLLRHYAESSKVYPDLDSDPDGRIIVETLAQFKIPTQLVEIQHGPTFTLYELVLGKGIRVNSVLTLADNIAMDLAVQSVRILAPIPGKTAIGIEVPNKKRDTIGFDSMMSALKSKDLKIPMVLGKTITGDSVIIDLAGAPHLLIAGTTGSGKSVCVNSLICSILYTKTPKQVRMILVDPKMVELTVYNDIPHLLTPVITDPKKAIKAMAFIVEEMERRMSMFSQLGARKIEDYNEKILKKGFLRAPLPYIVVVIDEFADLMTVVGKELEAYIKRITAVARFTGIHLVLATQRPSADVITGIIKSNMPTQIAFAVSNQVNSRIILDSAGAEKLLGRGDMLYASASNRVPQRIQGAYIDSEIEDIVKFVKTQGQPDYIDEAYFEDDDDEVVSSNDNEGDDGSEDMFTKAWKIVADRGEASASYLQRRLSIGYNRAANLIEQLEEAGYIGPARGSKPREILRYPDSNSEGFIN